MDVHKRFGRLEVLRGVDMEVARGEVVVIIGPSGSGKTTFLRCINHLERVDGGRIYVDGELVGYREKNGRLVEDREAEVARKRAAIGMVFQRFNLFPHLTALGNVVEAPLRVQKQSRREAADLGRELLGKVGLADKLNAYPAQLSGGQQQRVAVARAVVGDPSILLADEPTGNLDSTNGEQVMDLLRELHRGGSTICMVTHDPRYADHAQRQIQLFDGRIVDESASVRHG